MIRAIGAGRAGRAVTRGGRGDGDAVAAERMDEDLPADFGREGHEVGEDEGEEGVAGGGEVVGAGREGVGVGGGGGGHSF